MDDSLSHEAAPQDIAPPDPPLLDDDTFPASHVQRQLHFVQSTLGSGADYHLPVFLRADGPLDTEALGRAVALIAERHEALRTRLRVSPDGLLQVVDHDRPVQWAVDTGVTDVDAWMRTQALRPFDLSAGPLFRAALADLGQAKSVLALCFHHAVCDGWSVRVVLAELLRAYEDLVDGGHPRLPDVDYQFGDYSLWHGEWLESRSAERQLEFWETTLAGDLPVLESPPDVPPGGPPAGAVADRALPVAPVRRLRELARTWGATPFAVYLAAYQLLLGDYCGQADVLVGVPTLNRTRAEFRDTVGCFVNMVVVRTNLDAATTFTELVAVVREGALRAQDNQGIPFDLVVRRVNPPRLRGVTPLVQAAFNLDEGTSAVMQAGGVRFTPAETDSTTAKFPVSLQVNDIDDAPAVELEYRTDRYSSVWADRFTGRYAHVLELAAANPDRPLGDFFTGPRPRSRAGVVSPRRAAPHAAPRDDTERVLCEVWAEVLGVPRVGIDDNFFEIGGDSIRVVQIVTRADGRGVRLDVMDLLRHQTIRELGARKVRTPDVSGSVGPFTLISPADRSLLPADAVAAYPLSTLQVGMLYHSDTSTAYHDVITSRLRVPTWSGKAWRDAVGRLVERHELLRTSFDLGRYSEPLQVVHAEVAAPVTVEEIDDDHDLVARRMQHERDRPFDPATAPMVRFHVQRRPDGTVQLWTVLHHAVLDGWSERQLFGELIALYLNGLGERADIPPPPQSHYRQFVALERAAVEAAEHAAFWRDNLAGHVVTRVPTTSGARERGGHTGDLPGGLVEFAATAKVPLRVVLLALHLRVLGTLADEDDVLSGVVYNGRLAEVDGDRVIGLFLNTLPFRLTLGDGSWRELVAAVMAADIEVQHHERVPLSQVQRLAGGQALFDVFFNYTHFHNENTIPGTVEVIEEDSLTPTNFQLAAEFHRDTRTDTVSLTLNCDDAWTANRFHGYYVAAARALIGDPDAPHSAIDLLSAAEKTEFARFNDTDHEYASSFVLHDMVREQARRTPDAIAVETSDVTLTYAELDQSANHVAHRLVEFGVRRGDRVAVCLERRAGLVVALLAVLKSGGAYVPLDPDDPPARAAALLADAEARLLLTDSLVPPDDELAITRTATAPSVPCEPSDPAYMIFTSGSTGRPKGVVVSHRAIANRLLWTQDEFGLLSDDKVLQKTPATFDVSVWEFFWPLVAGAGLVVARPGGHRDPEYLVSAVGSGAVTVLHFVPSMLRAFLDADGPRRCPGLRLVISSGEPLPRAYQREFALQTRAELANLYGPTEAAVDATFWRCGPDDDDGPVPIGRPIANMRAHVLGRRKQLVPTGTPGELHLAGVGLAEGYHGQPELTASRFTTHVWPDGTAERLYRTGDLVRRRDDGALEFLGRDDDQVKIRGMRVELGEIEAALSGVAGSVAVTLTGDRLAAYVTSGDVEELRRRATDRLPRHMVPSVWVRLPALPLTASGKVDRRALPDPVVTAPSASRPPATATERVVAGVWAEVLGVDDVGADVAFADLGGHSLTALRLVARLRQTTGWAVTIGDLLAHDTVALLADVLDTRRRTHPDEASVVRLRRSGDRPPVLMFHPVGGSVFCYRGLAAALPTDRPVLAVASAGLDTGRVPHRSVAEQSAHYLSLLDPTEPAHLFGWSYGAVLAHDVACRLRARGAQRVSLTMVDAAFPGWVRADDDVVDMLIDDVRGLSKTTAPVTGRTPDERLAALAADPATGLDLARLRARAWVLGVHLAAHRDHTPGRYAGVAHYLEGSGGRDVGSAAGWRTVVDELRLHQLEGGHHDVLHPPDLQRVVDVLSTAITEAEDS